MPTAADAGAGYSGTPLTRKLGVRPGHRVLLLGAPHDFDLPDLPDGATVRRRAGTGRFDVVLAFCPDRRALERRFDAARAVVPADGAVWLAWPKRSSGVATDVGEALVRSHGLDAGLVDTKVCAVDGTWSALRFVRRRGDR